MKNKVKIKRLLFENYCIQCADVNVLNQIKEYLSEKGIGGFDYWDNKNAIFRTEKVLKGVVKCCMWYGINFEVEFQ